MPQIEFLNIPVGELRKNPWNTNKVPVDNEGKIRRSIERNGMFKPIIVREVAGVPGYEIIGGEHRWEQAIELGYETVPVANLGYITDLHAKEIGVIDNARYGADDTLTFSELLKELGDISELQDFLPYGNADLDALFSASTIALDELDIDESFEAAIIPDEEEKVAKPTRTHTIMRFKLSLSDAERLTALIAKTQKIQGLTTEDALTNAGDALVHLISDLLSTGPAAGFKDDEDLEAILDAALNNPEDL